MSMPKTVAVLIATASLWAVAGCTQASKGAVKQSDFASQYRTRYSVSKDWSNCIATQLFKNPDQLTVPAGENGAEVPITLSPAERKDFNATKPSTTTTKSMELKAEKAGARCSAIGKKP